MPNIGPLELIVVLVIALVILGPKKLPGLGRSLGTGMREFKDSISGASKDDDKPALDASDDDDEPASSESRDDAVSRRRD
ncbi:MAG: Sec-independent protein translocase subunit TatA/TatB [Solirubrobacteraceae bacterium]